MSERGVVEAALFVASGNITADKLAKICNIEPKRVREIAEDIIREYSQRDGGIEVFKAEKAYGMRIKPEYEENVTPLIPETEMPKAMLKTLAMIAYEQPVKQSYLVKIRGNRVYEYMKRLEDIGFIERRSEGHTKILTTTPKFRQYFRINDAKELIMKKSPVLDAEDAEQTKITEAAAPEGTGPGGETSNKEQTEMTTQ